LVEKKEFMRVGGSKMPVRVRGEGVRGEVVRGEVVSDVTSCRKFSSYR